MSDLILLVANILFKYAIDKLSGSNGFNQSKVLNVLVRASSYFCWQLITSYYLRCK